MKKINIPTCMNPFEVSVNGVKHSYPAGTEQEVPMGVAMVIEQHGAYHEEKERIAKEGDGSQGGGTGGGATCKLKIVASNNDEYGYMLNGTLYVPGYEDIDLSTNIGTTEYEVPCGSIVFAIASCSYCIGHKNVTHICEYDPYLAFRVNAEPGGEAYYCISAYC